MYVCTYVCMYVCMYGEIGLSVGHGEQGLKNMLEKICVTHFRCGGAVSFGNAWQITRSLKRRVPSDPDLQVVTRCCWQMQLPIAKRVLMVTSRRQWVGESREFQIKVK